MNHIDIKFIPAEDQRYATLGDWWHNGETLYIRSSGEGDEAFLIAFHELIEAYLCHKRGITGDAVDVHDFRFEEEREAGKHGEEDEPGDHPDAPYLREHRFAMVLEHLFAYELGLKGYGVVR
jgi:hypothetical protein